MKVLAIRGKNLASLEGEWEVDLSRAPLSEAGLLAISGPTGAGKSTILDAMCLALFDRTPRLQGRGRKVGFLQDTDREVLNSQDPRCLLRRGCSEAIAEVDFEGRDTGGSARRWRATWSVRRARLRREGRIQGQTIKLVELESGVAHGGTKTQTLEAIEAALGLDYASFCRSVLLAQGEFASLLRASPTEKAALLERVTGTWLYGELSVAAYRRATRERQQLSLLEAQLEGLTLLEPAEREALRAERAAWEQRLDEARTALRAAEDAIAWGVRLAALQREEAQAEATRSDAERRWAEAASRRDELAAVEAAQPLRGQVQARDASAGRLAQATEQLALREQAARASEATARSALLATERARAALEEARAARAAREPDLRRARELDVQCGEATQRAAGARREATHAREQARAARSEANALAMEAEAIAQRRDAAAAWLELHRDLQPLAAQWPRWEALILRVTALADEVTRRTGSVATLEAEGRAAQEALELARLAHREVSTRFDVAQRAWTEAQGEGDPRRERQELEERRVALVELVSLGERAHELRAALAAARTERDEATAEADAARAGEESARKDAKLQERAQEEAERALESARGALSLEEQRHELVPGQPCPLCGAAEHPYAEDLPPFSRFVAEQAERVKDLRTQARAARLREERARNAIGYAEGQAEQASLRARRADAALHDVEARWSAAAWPLGWTLGRQLIPGEETEAFLAERLAVTRTELQAARAREEHLEAARERLSERRQALAKAREVSLKAEQRAAASAKAADAERATLADRRAALAEGQAELAEAFPGPAWREALAADPAGFLNACRAQQVTYQAQASAREQLATEWTRAQPRIEAARRGAAEREQVATASEAEADRLEQGAEAKQAARAALLEGRPVAEVEAELDRALRATEEAAESARLALEAARRDLATATTRAKAAQDGVDQAVRAKREAEGSLATALAAAELELDSVRRSLRRDGAWLQATRAEQEELARTRAAALATLEVRTANRVAHERERADSTEGAHADPSQAAGAARAEATKAEAELRQRVGRLDADARALARAEALQPEIAARRERSDVWASLSEVIGSSDGKRFRVFAQSLTLELLLERANAYLRELAPRYQLERVRGQDLDLQVLDRVLGDEVRPTSSLSGGESFLVSLALALGLSALSSRETPVESLFIDEGFGSLDAESQELALATLDALQASGRQVTLISHVPGLTERIGVGVRVEPTGQGRSEVQVAA